MHRTEAHALAAILRTVNESEKPTLRQRWGAALGDVHPASREFAQRHSEAVTLLTSTLRHLEALPEDKRLTYEPFTTSWWTAVVSPDAQWNASGAAAVIGAEHLALLSTLGDVVEARMDNTAASPGGFNLDVVRMKCEDWTSVLSDDLLPPALARSLSQAIDHLVWVIDNADLFGLAHVASVANSVTGDIILTTPHIAPQRRKEWAKRLGEWTATLMAFSAFTVASVTAIEGTERLARELSAAAVLVVDQLSAEPPSGTEPRSIAGSD